MRSWLLDICAPHPSGHWVCELPLPHGHWVQELPQIPLVTECENSLYSLAIWRVRAACELPFVRLPITPSLARLLFQAHLTRFLCFLPGIPLLFSTSFQIPSKLRGPSGLEGGSGV